MLDNARMQPPPSGHYPVPGPGGTVLRGWDGESWSDAFEPEHATSLPDYERQPWRWLTFPGWLLAVLFPVALGGATYWANSAASSSWARLGLALSVGVVTAVPAIALFVLLDRRIAFGQLGRARTSILAWGIGSGVGSAVLAIFVVYAVSGEWNAPLLTAPGVPGWLVGVLHGPLKLVIPLVLWWFGKYRVPRQGFLLVLISAMAFAIAEATADAWFTATLDHQRTGAVIITVLLAALVAAVPWRAAWRRRRFFTWPAIAAIGLALALHWLADTLIIRGWGYAAVGVVVVGYLAVKVVARQLVPPDRVAQVSSAWRPTIGTMLSPDSPLLSRHNLDTWIATPGHRALPNALVSTVRGASRISRALLHAGAVIVGVLVVGIIAGVVAVLVLTVRDIAVQRSLDPFYAATSEELAKPGQLLRTEPMTADSDPVEVPGGTAYRMLYTSARPDGSVVPVGGMVFVPNTPAPDASRPVLAWAHPTLGEGAGCAPSRSGNPLLDMQPWLTLALERGWVVVATDYAGVGTPGTPLYLVGQSEARDVMFAVEAARQFTPAEAGTDVAVLGHSQGGHSALWTGLLGERIAPELDVVAVAAAAPAAELTPVFEYLWDGPQAWLLSPDVVESWTTFYPDLSDKILTPFARVFGPRAAQECLTSAAVQAQLLYALGLQYTVKDPLRRPGWAEVAQLQTPAPMSPSNPFLLVQSTSDETIPPDTNAQLQVNWCRAGSSVDALWLSGVSHVNTAVTASPAIIDWLGDRFAGLPPDSACGTKPPVDAPAPVSVL